MVRRRGGESAHDLMAGFGGRWQSAHPDVVNAAFVPRPSNGPEVNPRGRALVATAARREDLTFRAGGPTPGRAGFYLQLGRLRNYDWVGCLWLRD